MNKKQEDKIENTAMLSFNPGIATISRKISKLNTIAPKQMNKYENIFKK